MEQHNITTPGLLLRTGSGAELPGDGARESAALDSTGDYAHKRRAAGAPGGRPLALVAQTLGTSGRGQAESEGWIEWCSS